MSSETLVVGIVPSFDEGNNIPAGDSVKRIYIRHDYMNRLAAAGAVPLILHPDMSRVRTNQRASPQPAPYDRPSLEKKAPLSLRSFFHSLK